MDVKDCIEFATANPLCYIASIDGDQPRVRTVMMWKADASGFYFVLFCQKDMTKQLKQNPKTEICFFNAACPNPQEWTQLRVTGKVEFLEDEKTLEEAYQARSFLEAIAGYSLRPFVAPCRIASGEAHFWHLSDACNEPKIQRIKF